MCKRAVELTGEVMEVFGGNGCVDDGPIARLFREAPVNSIWEGSGNVMCLDVLRAISREPDAAAALFVELADLGAGEPRIRTALDALRAMLAASADTLEASGRVFAQRLAVVAQACLLRRDAPAAVADAFVATRLAAPDWAASRAASIRTRSTSPRCCSAYPA